MKIIIISDSHLGYNIEDVYYGLNPDMIFHAGDSQLKANDKDLKHVNYIVRGNCDFERKFNDFELIDVMPYRIFLTHGHLYNVNFGVENLVMEAKKYNCNLAIYGHSHVVHYEDYDNVHVINPGSVSRSRSDFPETFMSLDTETGKLQLINAKSFEVIKTFELS